MNTSARCSFMIGLLVLWVLPAAAQQHALSADSLQRQGYRWLVEGWRYHPGDDPRWADPAFDDEEWEMVATGMANGQVPASGWDGVGWFRLHLSVDPALRREPLMLTVTPAGTAQVYLDGELLHTFGTDAASERADRDYKAFSFPAGTYHVLAVRYANADVDAFHRAGRPAGFYLRIGRANAMVDQGIDAVRSYTGFQMFFTALALAFGLLHLILFLFTPGARANLYYALFLLLFAGNIFFDYQVFLATDLTSELTYLRLHRAVSTLALLAALRFVYALFRQRLPRTFWWIAAGFLVTGGLAVYRPTTYYGYVQLVALAVFAESARVVYQAVRDGQEDARILAAGLLFLFAFASYDLLLDLELMDPIRGVQNAYEFGTIGLFIAMSVYLARDVARTSERLVARERELRTQAVERARLEAENARQTRELEEARALQLAMLPQTMPALPQLDLAVHMQTATEVGGDYYDYHLAEDGTLTLAIGDATGHGTRAGMMVAIAKSLFKTLNAETDLRTFFGRSSRILKQMQLGPLYMAMTLARLQGHTLITSAAGMPPLLIYRAQTQTVEVLTLKGMPLGAFPDFPYQRAETTLAPGDTVLLLTDGLPELFNEQRKMLELPRVQALFQEVAEKTSEAIIEHLHRAGEQWRGRRPQDDDITLVVIQARPVVTSAESSPSASSSTAHQQTL